VLDDARKSVIRQVRKFARGLGCELHRANPMNVWEYRVARMLNDRGIRTVLDVGANAGQYAGTLLENGFRGTVLSFEPLPDAWDKLRSKAASSPRWQVAERIALSDRAGEAAFYEAANSVSSSLLPMSTRHLDAAPNSTLQQEITVKTAPLDEYLAAHPVELPAFLKIDVQGAETLVLRGAQNALRNAIAGLQLEMSLQRLYDGQQLYWELDGFLRSEGFECCDILPEFRDSRSFELLQFDGIYFRSGDSADSIRRR
jgi:FkbM family methyltransferase